jgi:hypothetical protein
VPHTATIHTQAKPARKMVAIVVERANERLRLSNVSSLGGVEAMRASRGLDLSAICQARKAYGTYEVIADAGYGVRAFAEAPRLLSSTINVWMRAAIVFQVLAGSSCQTDGQYFFQRIV